MLSPRGELLLKEALAIAVAGAFRFAHVSSWLIDAPTIPKLAHVV